MHSSEHWLPAAGFTGLYEVSDIGRVRRVGKSMGTRPGKILKPVPARGYDTLRIRRDGAYHNVYIHRLVMQTFKPNVSAECVNHINGKRNDNRLVNLEWCSMRENLLHASRVLGERRGSKHWNAKLSEADIIAMREAHSAGESVMSITRRFKMSHASISKILSGGSWRHVNLPTGT